MEKTWEGWWDGGVRVGGVGLGVGFEGSDDLSVHVQVSVSSDGRSEVGVEGKG